MAAHGRPAQIRAAVPARPDRAPEAAILAASVTLSSQEHMLLSSAQRPSPSQDSGREAPSLGYPRDPQSTGSRVDRLERELLKALGASSCMTSVEGSFSTPSLSGGAAVARWTPTPTKQPPVRGLVAVEDKVLALEHELVRRLGASEGTANPPEVLARCIIPPGERVIAPFAPPAEEAVGVQQRRHSPADLASTQGNEGVVSALEERFDGAADEGGTEGSTSLLRRRIPPLPEVKKKLSIRCASGRMRQDTLLSRDAASAAGMRLCER
eukprot:scaffold23957_cov101-Isochrysis_galbana.AAC.1